MKKLKNKLTNLFVFVFLFTFVFLFSTGNVYAGTSVSNSGILTEYNCENLDYIHIPTYIDSKKVTEISTGCFDNSTMKGVTLPDGIRYIYSNAFSNCNNLTQIAIPDSVTYISNDAFYNTPIEVIYCNKDSYAFSYATDHNIKTADISQLEKGIKFNTSKQNVTEKESFNAAYTVNDSEIVSDSVNYYYDTDLNQLSPGLFSTRQSGVLSLIVYSEMYYDEQIIYSLPTVKGLSFSQDSSCNKISFDSEKNVTYKVYRSVYPDRDFEMITEFESSYGYWIDDDSYIYSYSYYADKDENCYSYSDYDTREYVTYYYKVVPFLKVSGKENVEGKFELITVPPLTAPSLKSFTVQAEKTNTLTLNWDGVDYIDGYYLYRSEENESNYNFLREFPRVKPKSFWDSESYIYEDSSLTLGHKYYYKLVFYIDYNGTKIVVGESSSVSAYSTLGAPKFTKSSSPKKKTNVIYWNKMSEADGYYLYYSTKRDKGFKKIKTISTNSKLMFTHKKLTNGVCYYYKLVAYKKLGNTIITGTESKVYSKYCDYYSHKNESYGHRYKRIFGKRKTSHYKSDKQASKNMKTLRIKVWDRKANGKKYTRYFTVRVHKNIAPSVEQMFKEIYKSKERFPIHDIGCYSWRSNNPSSQHCVGLAFDINANENYMIDGGKVLSGSCWKPKKNPYSIPLKCELVKILEKYGFSRGFWGDRKDYMHFSYFGG
jgi:hypothetical protein